MVTGNIATALTIFCSQYSTNHWGDLLRQELPELTDEDIERLCGLTEAMESHEPTIVHKDPGRFTQPLTRSITGKRRRRSKGEGTATSSQNSREAWPLPVSAPANATATDRKRSALDPSLPIMIRRSPRLSSEQSAPGTRSGKGAQPGLDIQSDQVTGQPPPPSPLAASQRLGPYRIRLSRLRAEPREIFTVPVPVRLARCLFCRHLPLFCSLLASIILPLGRTNLFSSRLKIECPQRTGKQPQRH
jgi:hypothetical protein